MLMSVQTGFEEGINYLQIISLDLRQELLLTSLITEFRAHENQSGSNDLHSFQLKIVFIVGFI